MINNRQNGRRRGRGGSQVRGPGGADRGNRIDNRARGNAAQLHEKYKNLARDAQTQGDRVMTEYYLQFADHYFRVLSESRARFEEQNQQRRHRSDADDYDDGQDEGEGAEREEQAGEQRRLEREPRRDREVEAEAAEAENRDEGEEQESRRPRRGRRGRPPRTEAADEGERIAVDRLPPSFSGEEKEARAGNGHANGHIENQSAEAEEAPAPRRRRTRRAPAGDDAAATA
ncbi:MAG TPA: DUF4167 domain-containing protein [Sphingomonas sp.]|nr:DUF4167 domain-containing protein [Sphingomonas sp.]